MSSHSIFAIKRFFFFFSLSLKADDDISFLLPSSSLSICYNIYKALLYVLDTACVYYIRIISIFFSGLPDDMRLRNSPLETPNYRLMPDLRWHNM